MLVEELALEIYTICRERSNSTAQCLGLISKNVINDIMAISDTVLEDKIRKYRETYKGLEDLSKYVYEQYFKSSGNS